jgi:HPt (histidine-containing phosphotransfer) domain-containing protein
MPSEFAFSPDAPVIDRDILQAIVDIFGSDDPTAILDLLDTFLVESAKQHDEMKTALASGDWVLLHRMAHSLKSSSATFGAMRLSEISAYIEQSSKAQCVDMDCRALIAMLSREHELACNQLRLERERFDAAV